MPKLAILLLLIVVGRAAAQDSTETGQSELHGWFSGLAAGVPYFGGATVPVAFTAGISETQLRPNAVGADFWVGTLPVPFMAGFGIVAVRAGVDYPIALAPKLAMLPTIGVSGIGAFGGSALVGANVGASVLLATDLIGIRLGAFAHQIGKVDQTVWLIELGLVDLPPGSTFASRPGATTRHGID